MGTQENGSGSEHHPGYEKLAYEISTLFSSCPPPFIYINDPTTPRITSSVVNAILRSLSDVPPTSQPPASSPRIYYAQVNGVACFTARLLYDSILNGLVKWNANWDDGCANWGGGEGGQRWNENLDGFLHGLRVVRADLCKNPHATTSGKRKGKEKEEAHFEEGDVRLVVVVERAERLKEMLPDLIVPLTRLTELSQVDLSIVFISDVRWEDIRPSLGASPDPYYIDISPPTIEAVTRRLSSSFLTIAPSDSSTTISGYPSNTPNFSPYHPTLHPLYCHFISMLCKICFPFTQDPQELQYISAARWPGFVQPVLDNHNRKLRHLRERDASDDHEMNQDDTEQDDMDLDFMPPSEDVRLRLSRLFNPSLTTALEALYPRLTNASDWAAANKPEADILNKPAGHVLPFTDTSPKFDDIGMKALPRMSKFILVAAFLASTNPAKSDLRMFGRGLDEKKRRRRTTKSSGRTKSGPAKISQRLLGPAPFPLDRVIAILGALLEENDVDTRPLAREFTIPGEYTDMELGRVGIYASIMELASIRLLHRTSPPDKIDGSPMFKCGVSYDVALALARQLDIPLNDLMWDQA